MNVGARAFDSEVEYDGNHAWLEDGLGHDKNEVVV